MAQKEIDKYCVYKHTAPDLRVYIGLTKNLPSIRWDRGHNYKGNTYFTRVIDKYGWNNFIHTIIADDLTEEEAKKLEIYLIALYHSNERKYGFNISSGGESKAGTKISEWHKLQISKASKNRIVSKETRQKLSKASKRTWNNALHKQKMCELNLGPNNPRYGKKCSDEDKIKRGARKTLQFDLRHNFIAEYISRNEASRITGIPRSDISNCCKGKFKQAGGYIWEWTQKEMIIQIQKFVK